jgi:uncharacterized protein (DUF58 family)
MLGFMAVSGVLGWLNIRGLAVSVRLPDEIYSGKPTLASVQIENRKRLLPSFLVTATVSGSPTAFILLDPGQPQTGSLLLAFEGRGRHSVQRALISSPFPVNFFVRFTTAPVAESFTVFPAPIAFAGAPQGGKPHAGQAASSRATGYDGELAKISDYRGGESLKLIHWRLSAKHEVFKVKEMTATTDDPVILELDQIPGRNLDERLSYCAYLVNRLVKGGRPVGLKLGDRISEPAATRAHRLRLLGELALYGKD